jgi:hypothetical protein
MAWRGFDVLVVSPTPSHPQDHGNRKRFFEVCQELKQQGARVHYVHYAAEHDWRHRRPVRWEREMMAAWDSYQLVAPSRPVHEPAKYQDHEIDEWADPALGSYISWAFSVQRYDVIIVGYTWMSFCFDYVPAGVFKICDTNDVFANRRLLLEANDIEPEFFHTTREGEARGLGRADLVWAIKGGEQVYFEKELGLKSCLTMLYSEPYRGWWTEPPSSDGWLRAGVIGARNSINRRNLEAFLAEALPIIESYMAPVKIVIAGGCSDDFLGFRHPNLEAMGRVADVADFYHSVDVIIVPMQFSTGLKIKVSEALSSGAPLISHAHAMEGYPVNDPRHALPSFTAMAAELVKLAFDRSSLRDLAAQSRLACAQINRSVLDALAATRAVIAAAGAKGVCVVAPLVALDERSLLYDQLHAALDYLRFAAKLTLFLTGSPRKVDAEAVARQGQDIRVFVDPPLAEALGEQLPETWTSLDLDRVLTTRGLQRAYFLADVADLASICDGQLRRAFVRFDAIEIGGGDAHRVVDTLRSVTPVVVIAAATSTAGRRPDQYGIEAICQIPYRRNGAFRSLERWAETASRRGDLIILAKTGDPLAAALVDLAGRLGFEAVILDGDDRETVRALTAPAAGGRAPVDVAGVRLVADLSLGESFASVVGEAARRAGVPVIRLVRANCATVLTLQPRATRATTVNTLLRMVARGLIDLEFRGKLLAYVATDINTSCTNDAGWTWLWQDLTSTRSGPKAKPAAAGLLG